MNSPTTEERFEDLLFNAGRYNDAVFRKAHHLSPLRMRIDIMRDNYNLLRKQAGLGPIRDWSKEPAVLIGK
jgi:hypothetical protein